MTDRKPILLLTRPHAASSSFATMVQHDVEIVISPLIDIIPVGEAPTLAAGAGAIFTSRNGIVMTGNDRSAWCVGQRTTLAAQSKGWHATYAGGTASDLVATLIATPPVQPLVHLRGTHSRGDVAERLQKAGLPVTETVVYDQVALPLSDEARAALDGEVPVIVPLFSPRSAALFASRPPGRARVVLIAMSADVAARLAPYTSDAIQVAAEPTAQAMRAIVEKCADQISLG